EQMEETETNMEDAEEPEEALGNLEGIDTDNDHSIEDEATSDEELKLGEIHGVADQREDMEYDAQKGYYVIELSAGLYNYTNTQDVDEKWVACALPDGVSVPEVEEIPSGLVTVTLPDEHTGVALKVPNVKGIGSESFTLELPLTGEPDDNDPNENLYLYNVDGNQEQAALIGEIKSNRDIDFSVMEDNS